jgi:Na+/melibiose symporter-like transporter
MKRSGKVAPWMTIAIIAGALFMTAQFLRSHASESVNWGNVTNPRSGTVSGSIHALQ